MTNVLANLTTLELLSPNSFPVPSQQTTMFLGIGNPPKLKIAHHLDETNCYSTLQGNLCGVSSQILRRAVINFRRSVHDPGAKGHTVLLDAVRSEAPVATGRYLFELVP